MEDKKYLTNILTMIKSLTMLYINGTIESSNENIRSLLENGLKDSLELQNELYQNMKNDGYYKIENIKDKEIKSLLKKLKNS